MPNPVDLITALVVAGIVAVAIPLMFRGLSLDRAFLICMAVCIYVAGLVDFYLRFESVYWLCYLLFVFVFAKWILTRTEVPVASHLASVLIATFLVVLACSTIANSASIGQFFVAIKMYTLAWLALPVLAAALMREKLMAWVERALLWMPMVQLPFVMHQHFWVAPLRRRAGWDAVVGTFGGDPLGGGASGTLMLYMILSIILSIAILERRSQQPRRLAYASIFTALVVLSLGETKAAFFLLPLAVAALQVKTIIQRPARALVVAALMGVFVTALWSFYSTTYWSTYAGTNDADGFDSVVAYFFDTSEVNYRTGEVGRGAALALWWNDTGLDVLSRALGNGGASARAISTVSVGPIGLKYYPLDVAPTALSQLLWDTGYLGAGLFMAALLCSAAVNLWYGYTMKDEVWATRMRVAGAIGLVVLCLSVYNRSIIDRPSEQLLLVFLFAFPSACHRLALLRSEVAQPATLMRASS